MGLLTIMVITGYYITFKKNLSVSTGLPLANSNKCLLHARNVQDFMKIKEMSKL